MRVTMMLADHAQVCDGKLFISGGGWAIGGPGPIPCGVGLLFHVPWDLTNRKIQFSMRLVDEDGQPVTQAEPPGGRPVQASGELEAGRPPGVKPGTDINVPIAFTTVLKLAPGRSYTWVLEVNGQASDDWKLSFATRERP